ncbi:hypothetical protein [Robertmurraya siralis]|uniref:hypothetical protein n=1 Tax=Robertmurraya siralis TaxID=77777 RepID=UPI0010F5A891|nr:hypothetical protein [Robertmurraya siralis]
MTKSKARKYRDKIAREGQRNPEWNRNPFAFADMRTRKTKTKKDHLYKTKHKNQSFIDKNDGSFYYSLFKRNCIWLISYESKNQH